MCCLAVLLPGQSSQLTDDCLNCNMGAWTMPHEADRSNRLSQSAHVTRGLMLTCLAAMKTSNLCPKGKCVQVACPKISIKSHEQTQQLVPSCSKTGLCANARRLLRASAGTFSVAYLSQACDPPGHATGRLHPLTDCQIRHHLRQALIVC